MKGSPVKTGAVRAVVLLYYRQMVRHPILLTLSIVGIVGIQIATIIGPLYLRNLVNILAQGTPTPQTISRLTTIILILALWWFIRWLSSRVEHFANLYLINFVMTELYAKAFDYLIAHSHNFFASHFSGSLTHKVNKFTKSFQVMYESIFIQFFPAILFVVGAVSVLYFRNHVLGLILGAWVVVFVLFQIYVTHLRQPLRLKRSEAETKLTGTIADAISNQSTVTLFSGRTHERTLLNTALRTWYNAGIRSWLSDAFIWSAIGLLMLGIELALMYGAVVFWKQGLITVGDFVLIQAYLFTILDRLVGVQLDLRRFFDAVADGGEMVEILEQKHEIVDAVGAKPLSVAEGSITCTDVMFGFNTHTPILEHFNLHIVGGERVALVGPSGAGKSTITKLLLRFYDNERGDIQIDGQSITNVTQDSLRNAIAFVPQEPVLFHRTLMENIRYGKRDATDEEVIEAAKKAHCHEFIVGLSKGYDTLVGERGVKLSGGERQRVAIARAILKNAPILLLDEATSSLDSESEALIQDALQVLMRGKTVIVIAHRLSTIMNMDRIVVIEKGRVVAEGTHTDLVEQKGLYHKLWSIQAGGFILDEEEDAPPEDRLAEDEEKS